MIKKQEIVNYILKKSEKSDSICRFGCAYAPINLALCKYWGKENIEINTPDNPSLSISIPTLGCSTKISIVSSVEKEIYVINNTTLSMKSVLYKRIYEFICLFKRSTDEYIRIDMFFNVPLGIGFASSSACFASITLALNSLYKWKLDRQYLSILARLGSGSACRSIWNGFVEWIVDNGTGIASFGNQIKKDMSEMLIGILWISNAKKSIDSTDAMIISKETSPIYQEWIERANKDVQDMKKAINIRDIEMIGKIAESNSEFMHSVIHSSNPSINYSNKDTIMHKHLVQDMRANGINIYFSQDAGANLFLIFEKKDIDIIINTFKNISIIDPFRIRIDANYVVLIDEQDNCIGAEEKILAHFNGSLHRAFSMFLIRKMSTTLLAHNENIEVLIQKRQNKKYHSGGLWTNTCCGHAVIDEDIIDTAIKRLKYETGINVNNMNIAGRFRYSNKVSDSMIENELDYVMFTYADIKEKDIEFNKDEISDCKWISIDDLVHDIEKNGHLYTKWLMKVINTLKPILYTDITN